MDDSSIAMKRSLMTKTKHSVDELPRFTTGPMPLSSETNYEFDPIKFALVGDLGQTDDSKTTIQHIASNANITAILHAGDMSYADSVQERWDSWFELIEFLSKSTPWLVCPGNHEIETHGLTKDIFVPYQSRFCKYKTSLHYDDSH